MGEMLYKKLEKTMILPENIKQDLLRYFDKLSPKQIQVLSQLLQAENSVLLDFLRKQKDDGNIPVYQLKEKYIEYRKTQSMNREKQELQEQQENLDALLSEID